MEKTAIQKIVVAQAPHGIVLLLYVFHPRRGVLQGLQGLLLPLMYRVHKNKEVFFTHFHVSLVFIHENIDIIFS